MDIQILLAFQNFRNGWGKVFVEFFSKMTFFGELNTVLVIMALIYWAVDKELGTYFLMGWTGNRFVNGVLKISVCAYRPWIRDSRIIPYGNSKVTATGYSFPSGHSMNAASVFGGCAVRNDMPAFLRIICLILVLLVAVSRMFLGVHTPQDVLVGAAAGMLEMFFVFKLMQWLVKHPEKDWIIALSGIGLFIFLAIYAALKPYPVDYDADGKILVDGAKMANDTFKGVGWGCAFLIGWILERRFIKFSTEVSVFEKLIRIVTGLLCFYIISLIIVPLLKSCIPGPAGTIISCFIQMFFVTFVFPCFFKVFRKVSSNHQ